MDKRGSSVTESQFTILKTAECAPDTPAIPRHDDHHEMVAKGVKLIVETEKSVGGQLGRPSGARFRAYERLKAYAEEVKGTLFDTRELRHAIEDIYKFPLLQSATDTLNRQLKSGISNQALAELLSPHKDPAAFRVPIPCAVRSRSDSPEIDSCILMPPCTILSRITGRPFYNLSKMQFDKDAKHSLLDDPNNLAPNLNSYING